MRRFAVPAILLAMSGCVTKTEVPVPRYHVTDLATGKVYTAIAPAINKTAGGVTLREEDTGEHVNLSNYSEQRVEDGIYKMEKDPITGLWRITDRVK